MPTIPDFRQSLFLEGPAGVGKTTAAIQHAAQLIEAGESPESILILTPHNTHSAYLSAFSALGLSPLPRITTFDDFVQNILEIFWLNISNDERQPVFLNAELSRYYLSRFIEPYIRSGVFQSIRLSKSRIVGQIFDHLEQAKSNGLDIEEAEARAVASWTTLHSSRRKIYQVISTILHQYRAYCTDNHLLDSTSQTELFLNHLLDTPFFEDYYGEIYHHLIVDNIEEMGASEQDFVFWGIEKTKKTLVIYDTDGGYDLFSGVDPLNAAQFRHICKQKAVWDTYVNLTPGIIALIQNVHPPRSAKVEDSVPNQSSAWNWTTSSNQPEMINQCLAEISALVYQKSVLPADIAIVAPYMTDALRFSLQSGLESLNIPSTVYRPSRPLNSEPSIKAIMTLLRLVLPFESAPATPEDVAHMFYLLIDGLDPLRATLLSQAAYQGQLLSFQRINPRAQERISSAVGQRYEELWAWVYERSQLLPQISLADFLEQLLDELLSQPGYIPHTDLDAQNSLRQFIASARHFQMTADTHYLFKDPLSTTLEYLRTVQEGLITGTVAEKPSQPEAVFIAPTYHYLLQNRPVAYQFWLDVGNPAWWKSLEQPISRPYALRRSVESKSIFTNEQEAQIQQQQLENMILGLLRRCQTKVYALAIGMDHSPSSVPVPFISMFTSQPADLLT